MFNRRQLLAFTALGAASTALAGCGGDDDSGSASLTFSFWGNDERAAKYKQAIDLFQEANPTITVTTSFAAWADYWSQRATEAAGSSLPDVFQMDLAYLSQFGGTHQLLKLDSYLGNGLDVSGVDESLLPSGQLDDATYAIPIGANAFALYLNSTLLTQLGISAPAETQTWAQYQAWLTEAAAKGASQSPAVYASGDYTGTFWIYMHYLRQQGREAFTDDGQLAFTEDDLVAWWSATANLRSSNVFISAQENASYEPTSPFAKARDVAEMAWDNQLAGYLVDAAAGTEYVMMKIPSDTSDSGLFYKASMLLSASQNTEHPKEAAQLIDFLINNAEVGKIFGTSKGIPVTAAQRDAIDTSGTDGQVMAYEETISGIVGSSQGPLPEGFGTIETDFKRLGTEINYGNTTPEKAASEWYASATDTLAE